MNWVGKSELYQSCDEYIESLNYSVMAIAFKRISNEEMEIFYNRFNDLEYWVNGSGCWYIGRKINHPTLIDCMGGFDDILKESKIYFLAIYLEPNDTYSISYSEKTSQGI